MVVKTVMKMYALKCLHFVRMAGTMKIEGVRSSDLYGHLIVKLHLSKSDRIFLLSSKKAVRKNVKIWAVQ